MNLQVDIEKAFDKFSGRGTMHEMGFGPEMLKVMYWFYENIVMLNGEITNSWALVKLT